MRVSNNSYRAKSPMRYVFNPTLLCTNTPKPFHKPSFLYNFSSGSPSICCTDSDPPQKKQVLCSFLYGSPYPCLFHKNKFLSNSSRGLSSICNFESHSIRKKRYLYDFSSASPSKICYLVPPFSKSLSPWNIYNHNSNNTCSISGRDRCGSPVSGSDRRGSHCRPFSVSSSRATSNFLSAEEDIVQGVGAVCTDEHKLEKKIVDVNEMNVLPNFVSEIVDIIDNEEDLESRLNVATSKLNVRSISKIFLVLNSQRKSGLRFFKWVRKNKPKLHMNADVCSLIIDNCGCLDDYKTMNSLLEEFKSEKICLMHKAFDFLPVLFSTNDSLVESTGRVVNLLNEVGGSCRNSGICSLIEMFCKSDSFEMAKYVMEITEKKVSYYNILIRENCRRDRIEDAHGIITEMRELGCVPNAKTYNYLLGKICKNDRIDDAYELLEEMNKSGTLPDASTFEVLIHFLCNSGKVDIAYKFLDQMISEGLEPLLKTHASLVKALFVTEKYKEAHKYVVDSSVKYKTAGNMIYSFLANLHQEKGDIMSARNVLVEMMEKGLTPNFINYINIVKSLKISGRANLAVHLRGMYSKIISEPHPRPR
ncbi:Hypothetical predicted protein [Olea europaea subsp. europaea]|uniref:Pentatricopeptide repeat-containing protein n=1 Tax=Olea europaea subsp. europaea TaxID=158383 RepID=A0A8S0TBX6_OLEEU|nr:Hypothetical predicted protein [Olea europaea subsp. europaea]